MKSLSSYTIALSLSAITGSAFAAEMPLKAPPTWSWSGFYLGGSFGRAATNWDVSRPPLPSTSERLDGFIGGVRVGYNWQSGQLALGPGSRFPGND